MTPSQERSGPMPLPAFASAWQCITPSVRSASSGTVSCSPACTIAGVSMSAASSPAASRRAVDCPVHGRFTHDPLLQSLLGAEDVDLVPGGVAAGSVTRSSGRHGCESASKFSCPVSDGQDRQTRSAISERLTKTVYISAVYRVRDRQKPAERSADGRGGCPCHQSRPRG
jgi:hypothetical protein